MCGICGKINFDHNNPVGRHDIESMISKIRHRGPDGEGYYIKNNVGFGHARLTIIDLNTGHQPMHNEDSTVWVIFNGEIYNYRELTDYLKSKGHIFSSTSDTEVIIHLYEEYGTSCLEKLFGMFAFALWDSRKKVLLIGRDRVGIKPLYYYQTDKSLLFASEIKSILSDKSVPSSVNPDSVNDYFTFMYVPGEETLFKGIKKLLPGHYLCWDGNELKINKYWDIDFAKKNKPEKLSDLSLDFDQLMSQVMEEHMLSDVPVGLLLSGGVDSTAILSYATEAYSGKLSSFTIGFEDQHFADEREYARLAANRFGTTHHEMTISADQFKDFLPKYIWHMEEPVNEAPAVALYYISNLAKNYVKVLLSGEGGDEAFAGYPNYRNVMMLERLKSILSPWLLKSVFNLLVRSGANGKIQKYHPFISKKVENYYLGRTTTPGTHFLRSGDQILNSWNKDYETGLLDNFRSNSKGYGLLNKMLYMDTKTWLPDDLLIKADKITMANSIELRVPLLDHRVLEFAAKLPAQLKVNKYRSKYFLKKAFKNKISADIIKRKKAGFPVPIGSWFRNDLRSYISDILLDTKTLSRGYFKKDGVENILHNNSSGSDFSEEIFTMVVFELWHRQFIDQNG